MNQGHVNKTINLLNTLIETHKSEVNRINSLIQTDVEVPVEIIGRLSDVMKEHQKSQDIFQNILNTLLGNN